jgi:hypothetical protein
MPFKKLSLEGFPVFTPSNKLRDVWVDAGGITAPSALIRFLHVGCWFAKTSRGGNPSPTPNRVLLIVATGETYV